MAVRGLFRRCLAGAAVLALSASVTVVTVETASAASGNCGSDKERQSHTGPDFYRVRASCSSLGGNSKARGILDRPSALDYNTQYFTRLKVNYYGDWGPCPFGCSDRVEIKNV